MVTNLFRLVNKKDYKILYGYQVSNDYDIVT